MEPGSIRRLDHLPQLPDQPLWRSYRDWYLAQHCLIPSFARQRVGMREESPGVFVGLRTQIAPGARLVGTSWIGASVWIGPNVTIGAGSIIEDGCYVDEGAEISGSIVGPRTYVGAFTELRDSFAWGRELLNLGTGSLTEVVDRFLLSEVEMSSNVVSKWLNSLPGIGTDGQAGRRLQSLRRLLSPEIPGPPPRRNSPASGPRLF
jgi:hypothetical protein